MNLKKIKFLKIETLKKEAKEAVLLAAKMEPGLNLTNPAQFRRLLETLKVKLAWENNIYNWAR